MTSKVTSEFASGFAFAALVSGAGSGIGRAIAERFLSEGWGVIAVGRNPAPLKELALENPSNVLDIVCDLTKTADIDNLYSRLKENISFGGKIKALVNNAGIFSRSSFLETEDKTWESMFQTNLLGSVRLTRSLYPLIKQNAGSITNISSTLGLRPLSMTCAYSAMKAAMISWTETLAVEAAVDSVRVNCVCPGIVDTPIHAFHTQPDTEKTNLHKLQPLGRMGRPQDIAHAVWSLTGPGSEWITGSILKVDGGIELI
jgi:NAD(P)-dependent dehydrogenase (short-subunit alcohol dehydrogenase family)